jgi:hypothetical protein
MKTFKEYLEEAQRTDELAVDLDKAVEPNMVTIRVIDPTGKVEPIAKLQATQTLNDAIEKLKEKGHAVDNLIGTNSDVKLGTIANNNVIEFSLLIDANKKNILKLINQKK